MAKAPTDPNTTGSKKSGSRKNGGRSAAGAIEANPIAVLVGGLAVGLVAGALIPRGEREKQALAPVGKRIAEGAKAAVAAAKDTGKEHLTASMLSRDAATEGFRKVIESAVGAARGG